MSPLALLLAFACVASTAGFNHCSTLMLGKVTTDVIYHRQRTTGSHDYLYVPDKCAPLKKQLVGQEAIACDSASNFAPTIIPFGAGSFSPLYVNCGPENTAPCYELLTVSVTQYCAPAPAAPNETLASPSAGRNINKINPK